MLSFSISPRVQVHCTMFIDLNEFQPTVAASRKTIGMQCRIKLVSISKNNNLRTKRKVVMLFTKKRVWSEPHCPYCRAAYTLLNELLKSCVTKWRWWKCFFFYGIGIVPGCFNPAALPNKGNYSCLESSARSRWQKSVCMIHCAVLLRGTCRFQYWCDEVDLFLVI